MKWGEVESFQDSVGDHRCNPNRELEQKPPQLPCGHSHQEEPGVGGWPMEAFCLAHRPLSGHRGYCSIDPFKKTGGKRKREGGSGQQGRRVARVDA